MAGQASQDLYEAADTLVYTIARLISTIDTDKLEKLLDLAPRLLDLIERLDDKKLEALERLLDLAAQLSASPCTEEALGALEKPAEPVKGLRGLLSMLKDEEVARGLGRMLEILRALGRC